MPNSCPRPAGRRRPHADPRADLERGRGRPAGDLRTRDIDRSRRRRRDRRPARHAGCDRRRCAAAATPSTPPLPRTPPSASPSLRAAASAAAGSCSPTTRAAAKSPRSTTARPRRRRWGRSRSSRTAEPLAFDGARYSGLSFIDIPETVRGFSRGIHRDGTIFVGRDARSHDPVRARPPRRRPETFFAQVKGNINYFDDITSSTALSTSVQTAPRGMRTTLRNPDLARRTISSAASGRGASTAGGRAHDRRRRPPPPVAPTANHRSRPGVMRNADLHGYDRSGASPRSSLPGLDVYGQAPVSSGGSTVGEALNILEGFPSARCPRRGDPPRLEASRLAFADRGAYLGLDVLCGALRGLLSDRLPRRAAR